MSNRPIYLTKYDAPRYEEPTFLFFEKNTEANPQLLIETTLMYPYLFATHLRS